MELLKLAEPAALQLDPEQSLAEAAERMLAQKMYSAPVILRGKIIGVLDLADIRLNMFQGEKQQSKDRVREAMRTNFTVYKEGMKLEDVLPENQLWVPAEDGKGNFLGIITVKTFMRVLTERLDHLKNREGAENKVALAKIQDISDFRLLGRKRKDFQTGANGRQETLEKEVLERLRRDKVVVKSMGMLKIFALAIRASQTDSTVLLLGESGVGKEILARVIHGASNRADAGNFIQINCGAIPENLLESELFGYEAGAFTGATPQGKPGMFELADKGTLLLDEIGDLSVNLQVKLLRVLQDQVVCRLGGTKSIKLDVRIIAATNQNIWEKVQDGLFREDLFYRLNVLPIEVPPLRQRREDILPLTMHFIGLYNEKYGVKKRLDPRVVPILEEYGWPGNVRELQNVIERLLVLTVEDLIQPWHVQPQLSKYETRSHSPITIREILPIQEAKEILEKQLITMALDIYPSIRKAAEVLGLDHSNVVRKVSKYGIKK